jgi:TRAP-type C4-dicarboxylate transport system permease small subunit
MKFVVFALLGISIGYHVQNHVFNDVLILQC